MDRKIVVVTADCVEDTGIVSFKFMIDADLYKKMKVVPSNWGWLWKSDSEGYSINVFGSKGLIMGGGWDFCENDVPKPNLTRWHKEMLDGIPSCAILMTQAVFEWWEPFAKEFGVEFTHVHHNGFLKTS